MKYKLPENLRSIIDRYKNLKIGGKHVVCPYYIHGKNKVKDLKVLSGKGTPSEIELEVKIWAKVKKVDLESMNSVEIREFMRGRSIGIDCSGFIYNILDIYTKKDFGRGIMSFLKFRDRGIPSRLRRFIRPAMNVGANDLTSNLNTMTIDDLNVIRPGDLIRSKGQKKNAHHVGIISEVEIKNGVVQKFKYVNSIENFVKCNGVLEEEVIIKNPNGSLKEQEWVIHENNINYFLEGVLVDYKDNGIRRFKFVDQIFPEFAVSS